MSVIRNISILAVVLLVSAVACGLWGVWRDYSHPWWAAGVAGLVCWVAGSLGFLCVQCCARRSPALGPLAGTAVRMGLPLPVGIGLHNVGGSLAESHVFSMIMASYLVMLSTETLLLVKSLPASASAAPTAGAKPI